MQRLKLRKLNDSVTSAATTALWMRVHCVDKGHAEEEGMMMVVVGLLVIHFWYCDIAKQAMMLDGIAVGGFVCFFLGN